jgi:hypothetical protein
VVVRRPHTLDYLYLSSHGSVNIVCVLGATPLTGLTKAWLSDAIIMVPQGLGPQRLPIAQALNWAQLGLLTSPQGLAITSRRPCSVG